jgi:hypothetical protein
MEIAELLDQPEVQVAIGWPRFKRALDELGACRICSQYLTSAFGLRTEHVAIREGLRAVKAVR